MNMLLYDQDPETKINAWRIFKLSKNSFPVGESVSSDKAVEPFLNFGQSVAITTKITDFRNVAVENYNKQMICIAYWNGAIYKLICGTSTSPSEDLHISKAPLRRATHKDGDDIVVFKPKKT